MAVEIGRAVFPPDRAALAQRNLGRLDRNVRTVSGITRPPRGRGGATGLHQFADQCGAARRFEMRVGGAPQPSPHHDIAPIRRDPPPGRTDRVSRS